MVEKNNLIRDINFWRGIYILYFGVILILKEIGPYDLIPKMLNSTLVLPAGFLGVIFILFDLVQQIKLKKFEYNPLLFVFLVIMGISSLLNYHFALTSNIKLMINEAIYLLVIYQYGKQKKYALKMIDYFSKILITIWTSLVFLSLLMFVTHFEYSIKLENRFHPLRLGFIENRLFGIFSDPNFASTICLVTSILCMMYLVQSKIKIVTKIFLIGSIFLNLCFIILSGSRTGLIEVLAIIFIAVFVIVSYHSETKVRRLWLRGVISLAAGMISVILSFFVLNLLKQSLAVVPELFGKINIPRIQDHFKKNPKYPDKPIDLTRKDVENTQDLSNGRFGIWKNGFEMFKQHIIFGVGPSREGIVAYAENYLPNSYVAKTGLSLHSFIVHTLTGTGLLGFITFFSFIGKRAFEGFVYLFNVKTIHSNVNFFLLLAIIAIGINAVLSSEIILVNKIGAFIFWLFLGFFVTNQSSEKKA